LVITPAGPCPPTVHRIVLARLGEAHRLEVTERISETRRRWTVEVSAEEVEQQFAVLKRSTVPAFPVSPMVCDGAYYELTIPGEFSELRLSWWTIAPEGAWELADFADWLEKRAGLGEGGDEELEGEGDSETDD
jgi:hypothetical protein